MAVLFRQFVARLDMSDSVYYNYIILLHNGCAVGWFGDQGKKGVCIDKSVLWPRAASDQNWRRGRAWNEGGHLAL